MKTILLIEDNDELRTNTSELLSLSNYRVLEASDGKAGVQIAIQQKPDLILCDIMMPGLDGYGVYHALRKNEGVRNTPFIFLTAKSERSDFRKGMEMGADDYIIKPFTGTELLNAVDVRLNKMDLLKSELRAEFQKLQEKVEEVLGKNALQSLTEDCNRHTFRKKELVYSEGNHSDGVYYVLKGKVKAYKRSDHGKELVVDLYVKGDFFGYIPILEVSRHRHTAQALEDTDLAIIPKADFEELVYHKEDVARKFFSLLADNISEKESLLVDLAYNSLRKKVADALLFIQRKYKRADSVSIIDLNRESIASIAGVATESATRTLTEFKNENLIEINEGKIKIVNSGRLQNLLN
jgi:CRP/FNR family transcriptional regulator, cyclic AMP receptor protein